MGIYFTDPFSLLHFATGVIVYFWGISFQSWFLLHLFYEFITNTKFGIWFINHVVTIWPGGKLNYDSYINILGDQFYGMLGWIFTHYFMKIFYKNSIYNTYEKV